GFAYWAMLPRLPGISMLRGMFTGSGELPVHESTTFSARFGALVPSGWYTVNGSLTSRRPDSGHADTWRGSHTPGVKGTSNLSACDSVPSPDEPHAVASSVAATVSTATTARRARWLTPGVVGGRQVGVIGTLSDKGMGVGGAEVAPGVRAPASVAGWAVAASRGRERGAAAAGRASRRCGAARAAGSRAGSGCSRVLPRDR